MSHVIYRMLECNEKFEFEGQVHSVGKIAVTPDSLSGRALGSASRKRLEKMIFFCKRASSFHRG